MRRERVPLKHQSSQNKKKGKKHYRIWKILKEDQNLIFPLTKILVLTEVYEKTKTKTM